MRAIARITILAVAAVALLGGCGSGDGTIPQDSGEELLNRLTALEDSVDDSECPLAEEHAQGFVNEVDSLPSEVEGKVERALREAADRLVALASDPDECVDTGATGETGPVDEPETTEETTATTEEATTEEEPPEEDGEEEEEPAESEEAGEPEVPSEGEGEGPPAGAGPPGGGPPDDGGSESSSGGGIAAPRQASGGSER